MKTESFPIAVGNQRQLLTQGKYLELQRSSTPQEVRQGCEKRENYSFHTGNATCHRVEKSRKSIRTGYLVGTPTCGTCLLNCPKQTLWRLSKPCCRVILIQSRSSSDAPPRRLIGAYNRTSNYCRTERSLVPGASAFPGSLLVSASQIIRID